MNSNTLFWRIFAKRSTISFFIIMSLFLTCILRLAALSTAEYSLTQTNSNKLKIKVSEIRGTIYDCNMVPITNNTEKIKAVIPPTKKALTVLSSILEDEELEEIEKKLKKGKPIIYELPKKTDKGNIACIDIYETDKKNISALHLIGYTDSDSIGVSGIEKAYNDILYSEENVNVYYECNAKGDILEGIAPEISRSNSLSSNAVKTTIDVNLQAIAETAALNIDCGAVLIAECKTGKIRAAVSRPYFDPEKTADYLNDESSPLLNRILNSYNVGSVFKPCVAAAGIEAQKSDFLYNCTGSFTIADRDFRCHKADGHSLMSLKSAIANSCNTYFYNYAFNIGAEEIYKKMSVFRFNSPIKICEGITVKAGTIPKKSSLSNEGALANLSIGQGSLLLSPVALLNLYSAIANGGIYYPPSVIEGVFKDGVFYEEEKSGPTNAIKKETALMLTDYLTEVITGGTGEEAKPETISAAGKTATAQTGKFKDGAEICQGWFCGFFPNSNPEYTVIVFSEDTKKQTKTCSQIFSYIADQTAILKKLN